MCGCTKTLLINGKQASIDQNWTIISSEDHVSVSRETEIWKNT